MSASVLYEVRHVIRTRAIVVAVVAVAIVMTSALAGSHVLRVHRDYDVWGWSPGVATPRLPFAGRAYSRSGTDVTPAGQAIAQIVALGAAPGGEILGPPLSDAVPSVIWLQLDDGRLLTYTLSGGP